MISGKLKKAPNHVNIRLQGQPNITMQYYLGYFDSDQLYDLEKDPYEQNNLAYDSGYKEVLKEMKSRLDKYLKTFKHPFDLEKTEFMETDDFKELAKKTRSIGTDHISWWHGMQWPPQEKKKD